MRGVMMALLAVAFGTHCSLGATPSSAVNGELLKLQRMDYSKARKLILGNGWTPLGAPCEQVSKDTCLNWPEIGSCTGVSPDSCGMVFVKNNHCMYVGTSGDEPDGKNPGAMRIERVTYRPGPCSKY